jgi:hypothetical protein
MNVGQNFEPLGAVEFGDEVGKGEAQILGPQMIGKAEIEVVAGDRLTVAFGGERGAVAELVEGVARGDIERPWRSTRVPSRSKKMALKLRSKQATYCKKGLRCLKHNGIQR